MRRLSTLLPRPTPPAARPTPPTPRPVARRPRGPETVRAPKPRLKRCLNEGGHKLSR
jgi:hypothetical protein